MDDIKPDEEEPEFSIDDDIYGLDSYLIDDTPKKQRGLIFMENIEQCDKSPTQANNDVTPNKQVLPVKKEFLEIKKWDNIVTADPVILNNDDWPDLNLSKNITNKDIKKQNEQKLREQNEQKLREQNMAERIRLSNRNNHRNRRFNNSYNRSNNDYNRFNNSYNRSNNDYNRFNNSYNRSNDDYNRFNNSYNRSNNGYNRFNNRNMDKYNKSKNRNNRENVSKYNRSDSYQYREHRFQGKWKPNSDDSIDKYLTST